MRGCRMDSRVGEKGEKSGPRSGSTSRYSRRRFAQKSIETTRTNATAASIAADATSFGKGTTGRCAISAAAARAGCTATDRAATACATSGRRTADPMPVSADSRADRRMSRFIVACHLGEGKRGVHSPQATYGISPNHRIGSDERQVVMDRMRDQHPIDGVAVQHRHRGKETPDVQRKRQNSRLDTRRDLLDTRDSPKRPR